MGLKATREECLKESAPGKGWVTIIRCNILVDARNWWEEKDKGNLIKEVKTSMKNIKEKMYNGREIIE